MNHPHQLLQRLRLELAHGEDPLVQPRAGARPQRFLERKYRRFHVCTNSFEGLVIEFINEPVEVPAFLLL